MRGVSAKMKVLLIRSNPKKIQNSRLPKSLSEEIGYVMPLGLAYIAAYLREKGVPVAILDAEAEELADFQIEKRIKDFSPGIVGITTMTPTVHNDLSVARIAKDAGSMVVMGGPQINAMPREMMQFPYVDFGILGEGEIPFYELVHAIDNNSSLDGVPGLLYKNAEGKIVTKPPYVHRNLDELPIPARDMLPYRRYSSIIQQDRLATVCTGRGCPYRCSFCFKQPSDELIRYRSPHLVVDEMVDLKMRYGIKDINFISDTFTIKKSFIEALCRELIDRQVNISWIAPTRADCVSLELMQLMKKAGCRSLRFGIESGSAAILKLMEKEIDKEKMIDAMRLARQAGIETFGYFIIGYLNETEHTVRETLNFVKILKPDLLMYNIATPLPGTKFFEQSVDAGYVDSNYWQSFLLNENYPRIPYLFTDTEKWVKKAYREFFFSPRVLSKRLLNVKLSNVGRYYGALKGLLRL